MVTPLSTTTFAPNQTLSPIRTGEVVVGWGGGEWMDAWKEDAEAAGLAVVDALIANEAPDDEAVEACQALGRALAEA